MEKFISNLIRSVTGKTFTYKDSFYSSETNFWFMNTTFDGKPYRVVSFSDDGVVRMYEKHPLEQKEPTHVRDFKFCGRGL